MFGVRLNEFEYMFVHLGSRLSCQNPRFIGSIYAVAVAVRYDRGYGSPIDGESAAIGNIHVCAVVAVQIFLPVDQLPHHR